VAEEERALALAEIEKSRAAIAKVEKALQEHDSASSSREKEVLPPLIMILDVYLLLLNFLLCSTISFRRCKCTDMRLMYPLDMSNCHIYSRS
jgi:hypothetical protein